MTTPWPLVFNITTSRQQKLRLDCESDLVDDEPSISEVVHKASWLHMKGSESAHLEDELSN